jgi:hypothetical protein
MKEELSCFNSIVDHILLRGTELCVAFDDLVDSIEQILLRDGLSAPSDGEHASLGADRADISAGGVGAEAGDKFVADVLVEGHSLGVDLEDLHAAFKVRQAKLNLPIETAGTCECRVEGVRSVGRHEDLDVSTGVETIKLVDNFEHGSLHLGIAVAETSTTNRIDLIEENDAGFLGTGHLEKFSDHASTLSHVPLDQLRSDNADETGIGPVGNSSGSESLSSAGGSIKKNTLWRVNSKLDKALRMEQRHLNDFSDLFNLLFAASKIVIGDIRLFFDCHHGDRRVNLGRKGEFDLDLRSNNMDFFATNSHAFFDISGSELLVQSNDEFAQVLESDHILSLGCAWVHNLSAATDLE